MATVDTTKSVIRRDDGTELRYVLDRKRRWNIGLRRHENALTGAVVLYSNRGSYRICKDFATACAAAETMEATP